MVAVVGTYSENVYLPEERPPLWVNVPPLPSFPLVGRDDLLARLVDVLIAGAQPAVGIVGMPGVGKTALVVALVHHQQVTGHFVDGVLWAGLGRHPDVPGIQAAWAEALGTDISDVVDPAQRQRAVCNALGHRKLLMIIDDAWDLDAARQLQCGGNAVCVLTTRNADIARQFAPGATWTVPELAEDPSVLLLRGLAPKVWDWNPDALRELARAAGGLPLTLMVLGGYLSQSVHSAFPQLIQQAVATLANPAARLQLPGQRLGGTDEQPLGAVIDISIQALQAVRPQAVTAFYALGAFAPKPAWFSLEAAKCVTQCDETILALLIGRNLVEAQDDRLTLHQTLAAFAAQHSDEGVRLRHRDYYLALVNEDKNDWQRIERNYPQIVHAWNRQIDIASDDPVIFDFVASLDTYQERRGLRQDNLAWLLTALDTATALADARQAARYLNDIGSLYQAIGETRKALDYYQQSLSLLREAGDLEGEAIALNNIGDLYSNLGDLQNALDTFQQALPIAYQLEDKKAEAAILGHIGAIYSNFGEDEEALSYLEESLALYRQMADQDGEAGAINRIAGFYAGRGDSEKALTGFRQSLAVFQQRGDVKGEAITFVGLGDVYVNLGEMQQALESYQQALPRFHQLDDPEGVARSLIGIGRIHDARGGQKEALENYQQALALFVKVGDQYNESVARYLIAQSLAESGDYEQAVAQMERVVALDRETGHPDLTFDQDKLEEMRGKLGAG